MIKIGNTEISTWSQCKRKWYLAYYRGLVEKESKRTGALALGSRIHSALEGYYRSFVNGENRDLISVHSKLVEADRLAIMVDGGDDSELDKDAELGRTMLEDYLQWVEEDGLDANLDILGSEHTIDVEIIPDEVMLSGKVDLLALDTFTNMPMMIDFKTSANFTTLLNTAHMSPQLKTYVMLYQRLEPEMPKQALAGSYRILKKSKRTARATPPFHLEHTVKYNHTTLNNHWVNTITKCKEILDARKRLDNGEDHQSVCPPTVSSECTWKCFALKLCPMFDDGSPVDDMIAEYYVERDPYDYRNSDNMLDII